MADDPVIGFGKRVTKRARLPASVIIAFPFTIVIEQYFVFLTRNGLSFLDAFSQIKNDLGAVAFIYPAVPVIVFAFFREFELHTILDKVFNARHRVGLRIAELMADLAKQNGYQHADRIRGDVRRAVYWFYQYANKQDVLRRYAFEVWEGYYASLYLAAASLVAAIICLFFLIVVRWQVVIGFTLVPVILLLLFLAKLYWSTLPKILAIPEQQVAEFSTATVRAEAVSRFG